MIRYIVGTKEKGNLFLDNRSFMHLKSARRALKRMENTVTDKLEIIEIESSEEKTKTIEKLTDFPEYKIWVSMKHRCYNKNNPAYKHYGGRGIGVSDEWKNSFIVFLRDMGIRPDGMTLDRIDNSKGYSKENCRWATMKEQSINKRKPKRKLLCGVTVSNSKILKYQSKLRADNCFYGIGTFNTEMEAHVAYMNNYFVWYGRFPSYVNVPNECLLFAENETKNNHHMKGE